MNTLDVAQLTLEQAMLGLLPAFIAAVALQQFIELMDLWLITPFLKKHKELILKSSSFVLGIAIAVAAIELSVLDPVMEDGSVAYLVNVLITGLIISGGTQSFNHILKYLLWLKQDKKADTDQKQAETEALLKAQSLEAQLTLIGGEAPTEASSASNSSPDKTEVRQ